MLTHYMHCGQCKYFGLVDTCWRIEIILGQHNKWCDESIYPECFGNIKYGRSWKPRRKLNRINEHFKEVQCLSSFEGRAQGLGSWGMVPGGDSIMNEAVWCVWKTAGSSKLLTGRRRSWSQTTEALTWFLRSLRL